MTRNDLVLIGMLIIFSLMPLTLNLDLEKKFVLIKINSEVIHKIDLSKEERLLLKANGGQNLVEIKNGAVRVVEADCPDKICIRRGAIKKLGETIACVPHNILIEVTDD